MSKFLCHETVQKLTSPHVMQVSEPRVSPMIQVRGPDWKIPCLYWQRLDRVVISFEERLGREDFLPIQPLMLAPGVGASRAPELGLLAPSSLACCEVQAACRYNRTVRAARSCEHAGLLAPKGSAS